LQRSSANLFAVFCRFSFCFYKFRFWCELVTDFRAAGDPSPLRVSDLRQGQFLDPLMAIGGISGVSFCRHCLAPLEGLKCAAAFGDGRLRVNFRPRVIQRGRKKVTMRQTASRSKALQSFALWVLRGNDPRWVKAVNPLPGAGLSLSALRRDYSVCYARHTGRSDR